MGKRIEMTAWNQKLTAYDEQSKVFEFDCVLGDKLTPTIPGHYRITQKDLHHVSTQSGRPMPYSLFFDHGRAIHGSLRVAVRHLAMRAGLAQLDNLLPESKKIASHGCVNLHEEDAKQLYQWAPIGTLVYVH